MTPDDFLDWMRQKQDEEAGSDVIYQSIGKLIDKFVAEFDVKETLT